MSTEADIRALLADGAAVDMADAPINIDRAVTLIAGTNSVQELVTLNAWADKQQTCSVIARHHGYDALSRVLKALATASVRVGAPMTSRVQSIADFYGIGE